MGVRSTFASSLAKGCYISALESTYTSIADQTRPDESRAQGYNGTLTHLVDGRLLGLWPRWSSDAIACMMSQALHLR